MIQTLINSLKKIDDSYELFLAVRNLDEDTIEMIIDEEYIACDEHDDKIDRIVDHLEA